MGLQTILRVPILPFGMLNAHLVIDDGRCVIVDSGLPGTVHRFVQAIQTAGLTLDRVTAIVITHGHVDHVGCAAHLRRLTGAPIIAHGGDLPHYRRERPMGFRPSGWFGRIFLRTGLMAEPHEPFQPDQVVEGTAPLDLRPFGCRATLLPTIGHTQGSLSVLTEGGDALVGDLVSSGILLGGLLWTSRAKSPPFEDDPVAVARALTACLARGMQRFHMGHGGPLPAPEIARHVRRLQTG